MSLIVYPYIRNNHDGKMIDIEESIKPPFNDLFGLEIWRNSVWGSKIFEKLGCNILVSLRINDIYAEGKELEILEAELMHIKMDLKNLTDKLKADEKSVEFRIGNALEAIRVAKKYPNGGVCIG